MANTIPCPNPVCPHDFSMTELQSAAQVVCPKCGFRMAGKGAAPPKPVAPKPSAKPAAPKAPIAKPMAPAPKIAMATPVQPKPAPPVATPIAAGIPPAPAPAPAEESLPDGLFFNPDVGASAGTLVRSGKPKKKFNWMRLLIVSLAVGFAASVVIAAIAGIVLAFLGTEGIRSLGAKDEGEAYIGKLPNAKGENEKVYKLVLPKGEWTYDGEIASRFKAHAAWKNAKDYDFWFALTVKDHGFQKPRDAEMLRVAIDKLEEYFSDTLELGAKAEATKFGALPAQKLPFRGEMKSVKWVGECTMFFNNGIAYWLFAASPDPDVIAFFAEALPEKHVFAVSDRKGWREQPTPTESFASIDLKFDVTAPKGVWERGDPKNEDQNGKLLLAGKYLREKDNRKNALLLIFTLDKKDDLKAALKAAREHLETREKESNDKSKIVHAADVAVGQSELGSLEDIGNRRGRRIDLKLMIADDAEPHRYYLLSVINEPDICYAIVCECSWGSRQIWRQDFLDVLRTLRVKKGE